MGWDDSLWDDEPKQTISRQASTQNQTEFGAFTNGNQQQQNNGNFQQNNNGFGNFQNGNAQQSNQNVFNGQQQQMNNGYQQPQQPNIQNNADDLWGAIASINN